MTATVFVIPGSNEALRELPALLAPHIEVRMIETPNEALWELQQLQPHIVVADSELTGMSGIEFVEIVPNFAPEARLLLCVRTPEPGIKRQGEALGIYALLEGRQDAAAIARAVAAALDTTASEAEPQAERPGAAAAAQPPADAAAAPEPPQRPAARQSTGPLVLTEQTIMPIRERLETLAGDLGAQVIALTDSMGAPLVQIGKSDLPLIALMPLLVTGFSTSAELTRLLQEEESATLYFHEGSRYDIYAFDVGHRFVLILLFDKLVGASKIGPAWVYTKRAIRDLLNLLR